MSSLRTFSLLAAVAAALVVAPAAQAARVDYTTSGVFGNGSSTIDLGDGNTLSFIGEDSFVNANPTSQATFGTFLTTFAPDAGPYNVSTTFTLTIGLLPPAAIDPLDTISFGGPITGTITFDNSGAFLVFDDLSNSINSTLGPILFEIVSSVTSGGVTTPGRININPTSTQNGQSTISGQITVIPEPASFVLLGLAAPMVVLYRRRLANAA